MGNDIISAVLVGCGAVSRFFYGPALLDLQSRGILTVEALVDPSAPNRQPLAELFPQARQYSRLEEAELRSRLVIIATPPKFHAQAAIHAMQSGAAVLCEKPMASSIDEAQAMIDTARATQSLLAVGLYKRFFPACENLKGILERQPLGRLKKFTIEEGGKFGWQAASDSFFRKSETPGGVLLDIGVHVLDLLLWWLGEPGTVDYEDDALGGQEANCRIGLTYRDGVHGEVRLSRDWSTRYEYRFEFERGQIRYHVNEANRLEIIVDGMPSLLDGSLRDPGSHRIERTNPQSFIQQIVNVTAAMRGREPLKVPGEEGIRSLRLIGHCYAHRRLMEMPWLTATEIAAAQCRP
jgi:predicted dehydrogenase